MDTLWNSFRPFCTCISKLRIALFDFVFSKKCTGTCNRINMMSTLHDRRRIHVHVVCEEIFCFVLQLLIVWCVILKSIWCFIVLTYMYLMKSMACRWRTCTYIGIMYLMFYCFICTGIVLVRITQIHAATLCLVDFRIIFFYLHFF